MNEEVKIVILGNLKFPVDISKISKSNIITVKKLEEISNLPNADNVYDYSYSDKLLDEVVNHNGVGLSISIINAPLEENFYVRYIGENSAIISLYEVGEIITENNYPIENFILLNALMITLLFHATGRLSDYHEHIDYFHDDIRGCIFDFTGIKTDVIYSLHKPILCSECRSKFQKIKLPSRFLRKLEKDLNKIRKPRFYLIQDWIKRYPILSLILTIVLGIAVNVVSNYIYDYLKN